MARFFWQSTRPPNLGDPALFPEDPMEFNNTMKKRMAEALRGRRHSLGAKLSDALDDAENATRLFEREYPPEIKTVLLRQRMQTLQLIGQILLDWRLEGGQIDLVIPDELRLIQSSPPVLEMATEPAAPAAAPPAPAPAIRAAPQAEPPRPEPASAPPPVAIVEPPPEPVEPTLVVVPPEKGGPITGLDMARLGEWARGERPHEAIPAADEEADFAQLVRQVANRDGTPDEFRRLCHAIKSGDHWPACDDAVFVLFASFCAARLKFFEVRDADLHEDLVQTFGTLTRVKRVRSSSYVHGLSQRHTPRYGSWGDDAAHYWRMLLEHVSLTPSTAANREPLNAEKALAEIGRCVERCRSAAASGMDQAARQLVATVEDALERGLPFRDRRLIRLVAPYVDEFKGSVFGDLRRAVRDQASEDADDAVEASASASIPDNWRWWSHVRDRRVVIFGGMPREEVRVKLERELRCASLEWVQAEFKPRALENLARSVEQGSYDLVILLRRFLGHDADQKLIPACKEAETEWISVPTGYGLNRIRASIEERFEPDPLPVPERPSTRVSAK